MASILDIGLLRSFVDIFAWLLVFLIVYGALEITNLMKNRGLHALFAFVITAVIVLTGGGVNIIVAMAPWVMVMAAIAFFILLLGGFVGAESKDILGPFSGKGGVVWYFFIPILVILIITWTQGSEETVVIDESGQAVTIEQATREKRPFIGVLTDPKVLGLLLIMAIGAMTLVLMARGGAVGGGH